MTSVQLNRGKHRAFLFVCLSFFINTSLSAESLTKKYQNIAQKQNLSKIQIWQTLIHTKQDKPRLTNTDFYLSEGSFSSENELNQTLSALLAPSSHNQSKHAICRFPARKIWLQKKLNIPEQHLPKVNCPEFAEYIDKAPAEHISLVYAAENVSIPSSMMGHSFFVISGKDKDGIMRKHGMSFFTILDSLNIPLLIYQNAYSGMEGVFALQPYYKQKHLYNIVENRNLWEYALKLSLFQKKLLHYHFWELKNGRAKYFFVGYNCASFIQDLLTIAKPEIKTHTHNWVTPLDNVKSIYRANIVQSASILPSNEWYIFSILSEISQQEKTAIRSLKFSHLDMKSHTAFQALVFSKNYIEHLHQTNKMDKASKEQNLSVIREKLKHHKNKAMDFTDFKTPPRTPDKAQWSIGTRSIDNSQHNNKLAWVLNYMPASHLTEDDNRQYFGESSLELLHISFLHQDDTLKLNHFTPYAIKTLIPWNNMTKHWSWQWKIAWQSMPNQKLEDNLAFNLETGFGLAYYIWNDIFLFGSINAGLTNNSNTPSYTYYYPEITLRINELFNMKTWLKWRQLYNESAKPINELTWVQSFFLSKKWSLFLNARKRTIEHYEDRQLELKVKFYF